MQNTNAPRDRLIDLPEFILTHLLPQLDGARHVASFSTQLIPWDQVITVRSRYKKQIEAVGCIEKNGGRLAATLELTKVYFPNAALRIAGEQGRMQMAGPFALDPSYIHSVWRSNEINCPAVITDWQKNVVAQYGKIGDGASDSDIALTSGATLHRLYYTQPTTRRAEYWSVPTASLSRTFLCQLKQAVPCPLR